MHVAPLTIVDAVGVMILKQSFNIMSTAQTTEPYLVVPAECGESHSNVGPGNRHARNVRLNVPK